MTHGGGVVMNSRDLRKKIKGKWLFLHEHVRWIASLGL
jgi:hypothetical protein